MKTKRKQEKKHTHSNNLPNKDFKIEDEDHEEEDDDDDEMGLQWGSKVEFMILRLKSGYFDQMLFRRHG